MMTVPQYRSTWQRFIAKKEQQYAPRVYKALQAQVQQFLDYASVHGLQVAVNMIHVAVTIEPLHDPMYLLYTNTGKQWGLIVNKDLKSVKRISFPTIGSQIFAFMERFFNSYFMNKAVLPITEYTRILIRERTLDMLAQGMSYELIANRLLQETGEINLLRSRRIVRTESVRAANVGGKEGAKKSGLKLNKRWISAVDKRTRRIPRDSADHLHMNGLVVPMDEKFPCETKKHGTVMMDQPGDSTAPGEATINCRCTASYVPVRDGSGRPVRATENRIPVPGI